MTENVEPSAAEAKVDAEQRLAAAEGRWPSIRALVVPLFAARQENHFAERLRVAMTPKDRA